jgi:hypothetical protein
VKKLIPVLLLVRLITTLLALLPISRLVQYSVVTSLGSPYYLCSFMIIIQQMCGRIGMVTGRGLVEIISTHSQNQCDFALVIAIPLILALI